jgi:hypothetical protein
MKKLLVSLTVLSFLMFGALSIQTVVADSPSFNIEISDIDQEKPKKDTKKVATDKKECKDSKEAKKCCDKSMKKKCDKSATPPCKKKSDDTKKDGDKEKK